MYDSIYPRVFSDTRWTGLEKPQDKESFFADIPICIVTIRGNRS